MLCIGKASSGTNRVNRGGSWNNSSNNLASAYRNNNNPNNENNNIGFRVCAP
jgi:formylglycine-generating enzyme required for sulfatase activity